MMSLKGDMAWMESDMMRMESDSVAGYYGSGSVLYLGKSGLFIKVGSFMNGRCSSEVNEDYRFSI